MYRVCSESGQNSGLDNIKAKTGRSRGNRKGWQRLSTKNDPSTCSVYQTTISTTGESSDEQSGGAGVDAADNGCTSGHSDH